MTDRDGVSVNKVEVYVSRMKEKPNDWWVIIHGRLQHLQKILSVLTLKFAVFNRPLLCNRRSGSSPSGRFVLARTNVCEVVSVCRQGNKMERVKRVSVSLAALCDLHHLNLIYLWFMVCYLQFSTWWLRRLYIRHPCCQCVQVPYYVWVFLCLHVRAAASWWVGRFTAFLPLYNQRRFHLFSAEAIHSRG